MTGATALTPGLGGLGGSACTARAAAPHQRGRNGPADYERGRQLVVDPITTILRMIYPDDDAIRSAYMGSLVGIAENQSHLLTLLGYPPVP